MKALKFKINVIYFEDGSVNFKTFVWAYYMVKSCHACWPCTDQSYYWRF